MDTTNKKRGRPSINIEWPNGVFTVKDVAAVMGGKLSSVAVQLKINKNVEKGVLVKVGQTDRSGGRPGNTYRKVKNEESHNSSATTCDPQTPKDTGGFNF